MTKLLKIIAGLIGVVVLLIIVAVIAVPLFFDPNDYKDQLTALVKKQTERELTIQGEIKTSVFPWLGVELAGVELSNAPGFGPEPFAKIGEMEVRVKLLPLLKKELEVDTVVLKNLTANLSKDASGKANWDDLKGEGKESGDASPLAALAIGGVAISDSRIVWEDLASDKHYTLDKLNVRTGALALNEDFDVNLETDIVSKSPALNGHIELNSTGNIDLDNERYGFKGTSFKAALNGKDFPNGKAELELKADINADLKQQTLALTGLSLQGMGLDISGAIQGAQIIDAPNFSGPLTIAAFNPRELMQQLGIDPPPTTDPAALTQASLSTELDASTQHLDLNKLALKLDDSSISGKLGVKDFSKPAINFTLALDQIDADRYLPPEEAEKTASLFKIELMASANAAESTPTPSSGNESPLEALRGHDIKGTLRIGKLKAMGVQASDMALSIDSVNQTLNLDTPKLTYLGVPVQSTLRGTKIIDNPTFSGPVKIAQFNPRELMQRLDIDVPITADPTTLTQASLSTELNASLNHADLTKLVLKLDDTSINGNLGVKNFAAPAINFALVVNAIDLDRYLAPVSTEDTQAQQAAAPPASAAAAGASGLPIEEMRALNVQGNLRVGKLKARNVRSTDVNVSINARNGQIKLSPLSAKLYEGSYKGNMRLDARGKTPSVSVDEALTGVQAGPLLKDFLDNDILSGKATVSAKLTAQGTDDAQIRQSLNGQMAFSFANGTVKGFNIAKLIRDAQAKLQGQTPASGNEPEQTDFSEIKGTAKVANGVLHNEDLTAKSPLLRVTGKGDIDIGRETMDYLVNASIVGSLAGQGGKELEQLKGITIPVRIKGPFDDLSYRPDLEAMLGAAAKAKIQEKIDEQKAAVQEKIQEKVQEQIGDKMQDKLKDQLKGLFP